ncbi:DNA alkylation repair protein [Olivibacter domesticus]|uniref:3-methyladenine DNA glycosylase AlkC n=1 Tax=Olivibacter domesticus TaxID=407022 RepID=A0A1H7W6Z5_OLID1|nr:DNA alkylation repair protein [Olivibacter domesticus]SEM17382.1 3-methyladenine DNA glycosylase AlkC [Olivibacter domesticus]
MSLIKNIYNPLFYNDLVDRMVPLLPTLEKATFMDRIFSNNFEQMEWKERMHHTTRVLHTFMPENFSEASPILIKIVDELMVTEKGKDSLALIFLPQYIAMYGLESFKEAIPALEKTTQLVSAEFAVRPFLLKYGNEMIYEMTKWSHHENHKVRRLASEGSRPRLPWGLAIPALKKNPAPILPLLEHLKNDPSEWVRKSVANSLNDIAKDHPQVVLEIANKWKGISKETDAIIKHGCRTLLKQGNTEALRYFGFQHTFISINGVELSTPTVHIGGHLSFSFIITNTANIEKIIRLEYGIHYLKANGKHYKKVFKISERLYKANEISKITRRHSFKPITTRVFYSGQHHLTIILNGSEMAQTSFVLA